MSNFKSEYFNYQQFEISTSSDFYHTNDKKLKNERKKLLQNNKIQKLLPIIFSILFLFLFLIILILY